MSSYLSKSPLRELYLECFDECVYNDLPQYLIRVSDMKLFGREKLRELFLPVVDSLPIDLDWAREFRDRLGDEALREELKGSIKPLLKYAILSHRWGAREPTFQRMSSGIPRRVLSLESPGYEKLRRFCEKAKADYDCDYVWSDTCCIDKQSSAELEEAIRSMFRWYRGAYVCIVHLAKSSSVQDFPQEPWFTRGWTLQELLAPERLRMYGKDWTPICPKEEETQGSSPSPNDKDSDFMLDGITKATDVDVRSIRKFGSTHVTLSEKMRWASKRKTTRIEDTAYSLLGIFDVTMPIAYGEGDMAFQRLLEAIAHRSQDPTFFAWDRYHSRHSLALPSSPASYGSKITSFDGGHPWYTIQKLGVYAKLLLVRVRLLHDANGFYTLEPTDTNLARDLTVIGRFPRNPYYASSADDFALGVVDFYGRVDLRLGADEIGRLSAGKHYVCVLLVCSPTSLPGLDLLCWKQDTAGVLPVVECKKNYAARLDTVCLQHSRL